MCQKRTVRNDSSVPSPPRKRPKMHNSWEGGWVNREEEEEEDERTIAGPFRSLPLIHTARAFVSASVARNSPTMSATFKTTFFPTHNQSIPICRKLFCVWRCFLRHCRMSYLHHLVVTVPATRARLPRVRRNKMEDNDGLHTTRLPQTPKASWVGGHPY